MTGLDCTVGSGGKGKGVCGGVSYRVDEGLKDTNKVMDWRDEECPVTVFQALSIMTAALLGRRRSSEQKQGTINLSVSGGPHRRAYAQAKRVRRP